MRHQSYVLFCSKMISFPRSEGVSKITFGSICSRYLWLVTYQSFLIWYLCKKIKPNKLFLKIEPDKPEKWSDGLQDRAIELVTQKGLVWFHFFIIALNFLYITNRHKNQGKRKLLVHCDCLTQENALNIVEFSQLKNSSFDFTFLHYFTKIDMKTRKN